MFEINFNYVYMKNLNFLIIAFIALLLGVAVSAQSPQSFRYQAVARDNSGNILANQNVSFRISILSGSVSGTITYRETHTGLSTNAFGLAELEIGKGSPVNGTFSSIIWGSSSYFIQVEMDPAGGTSYQELSTSQFLSVPYALYSEQAGNGFSGNYNDLTNKPLLFDGAWNSLTGKPEGTAAGEMLYWNGSEWVNVAPGKNGQTLIFLNGTPKWWPEGMSANDVYNPTTGKIWMDRNLGATQVATSSTDPNSYGDLYQWGRRTDGHQIRTSPTTTTISISITPVHGNYILSPNLPYDWLNPKNDNLWQGVSGTNNPCPIGYRLPTMAEWDAELLSWSSNNAAGAFASPLKLPVAGSRNFGVGWLQVVGSYGRYWSSTVSGAISRYLVFSSSDAGMDGFHRANGYSVRCLKD